MGMMAAFIASGGGIQQLQGGSAVHAAITPNNVVAGWEFEEGGEVTEVEGGATSVAQYWVTPAVPGIGAGYYLRATKQSGDNPTSGTLNTWLSLASDRIYQQSISSDTPQTRTCQLLIEIATDSGGTNVVTSAVYTITATVLSDV